MRIEVNDEYAIGSDQYQWIIYRKRTPTSGKQAGETLYEGFKYYSTLGQTITGLKDLMVRTCDAHNWDTLVEAINESNKLLDGVLRRLQAKDMA